MTVLEQYQRLECDGVWQPAADAQRRNVFVSLGEATLIIRDGADSALAHWSLPAIERINPGAMPAQYRPGAGSGEVLEIADETMIEAIRIVRQAVSRAGAHPGRLRRAVLWASLSAALALSVFWLPGALVRHTASVLPDPLRAEIGQRLLQALQPITGRACTAPEGLAALRRLRGAVAPDAGGNVVVVPGGPVTSAVLPGPLILLRADLIAEAPGPDAVAGALLAEATRAREADPLTRFLEAAGPWTALSVLTRGTVPEAALTAYADTALIAPRAGVPDGVIASAFARAGIAPGPYLDRAEPPEAWLADTASASPSNGQVLTDAAWLKLRGICED